jgi:hypothetical protein
MSKLKEIQKNRDGEDLGHVAPLAEEYDKVHSIKALADTEGGKEIAKLLVQNVVQSVHKLSNNYTTMPHTEMVALCATMKSDLSLARLITNSKDNLKHLDEMIADALLE